MVKEQRIGFTGTRNGLTSRQEDSLFDVLEWLYDRNVENVLVHGRCIGADEDAHYQALDCDYVCDTFPSNIRRMTARISKVRKEHTPLDPLDRNRLIVETTEVLVACPKGTEEERRSGTWMTVRYARSLKRPILIIWPNGTVSAE